MFPKKFVLFCLFFLTVAAIGIILYQFYGWNIMKDIVLDDSNNQNEIGVPARKIYRNERWGFELKYPSAWSIVRLNSDRIIIEIASVDEGRYIAWPESRTDIIHPPLGEMWVDITAGFSGEECVNKEEEVEDVYKYSFGKVWQTTGCYYSINKQGLPLKIVGRVWKADSLYEAHRATVQDIISTFTIFSDLAGQLDTTKWLTYKNEEFGYQFLYPDRWLTSNPSYHVTLEGVSLAGDKMGIQVRVDVTTPQEKLPQSLELFKEEIKKSGYNDDLFKVNEERFRDLVVAGQKAYQVEVKFLGQKLIMTTFQLEDRQWTITAASSDFPNLEQDDIEEFYNLFLNNFTLLK